MRGKLVGVAVITVVCVSCGGGDGADGSASPSTREETSTTTAPASPDDSALPATPPWTGGPPAGIGVAAPTRAGTGEVEMRQPADPCSYLTVAEWENAVDGSNGETQVLEHGDACGYTTSDESTRLAVAVLAVESTSRWLSPSRHSEATPVDGLPGAFLLRRHPTPESSTLVVELDHVDVILEMAAQGEDVDTLRDLARLVSSRAT
jgi:hypothetical protein